MTASVGREVDPNLLRRAAPEGALARPQPQDASRQDLGDLVEALGRGHEVEGVGHPSIGLVLIIPYLPAASR
jgi:hypothetical protein